MSFDYERMRSRIEATGFNSLFESSIDHGEQLTIVSRVSRKRLFSLAKRSSGWFLMGLHGFFHIGRDEHLDGLCDRLVMSFAKSDSVSNIEDIKREYLLDPRDFKQWCQEGEVVRKSKLRQIGWKELSDEEMEHSWKMFTEKFAFRRGNDPSSWPGIEEPFGALTWGLTRLITLQTKDELAFQAVEESLRTTVSVAFQHCTSTRDRVLALDLNHTCYSFKPHDARISAVSSWPISVVPLGNYNVFVTPDLTNGVFGHPWKKTLCIFGHKFADYFKNDHLNVLIRTSGTMPP